MTPIWLHSHNAAAAVILVHSRVTNIHNHNTAHPLPVDIRNMFHCMHTDDASVYTVFTYNGESVHT